MTAPVPSAPTPSAPPMVAVVLATVPPLFFPFVGLVTLAFVLQGGLFRAIQEAGWVAYLVLAATFFASLTCGVLGGVAARGVRVPAAVGLFVATLPWLTGLAGMRLGMHTASRAVANADPASRATMIAQGLSEAINARILGAWSSASLAMALGLSLAIGAAAQRADNRKWALAGVGLFLALPVLGVTGYALVSHLTGRGIVLVALLAAGTLLALPLAAGAPAGDAPHGRAAALSSSAVVLLLVGWLAGLAALGSHMMSEVFGSLATVEPSNRVTMLADAIDEMKITSVLGWVGGGTLALAALVVTGWAATRSRPTPGRIAGGAAVVLVALVALGADVFVRHASENDVAEVARPPWAVVAGFTPQSLVRARDADTLTSGATFVLGTDDLVLGTEHVGAAELASDAGVTRVAALVRAQLRTSGADRPDRQPVWLGNYPDPDPGAPASAFGPRPQPTIAVALDARAPASALRALARGAAQGGAHSLVLTGIAGETSATARDRIAAESPAMAALVDQTASEPLLLEAALGPGYADSDPTLWHATLDASAHGEITLRSGARGQMLPYPTPPRTDESIIGPAPEEDAVVYLALGDDATAASLAAAANAATMEHYRPLLVVGELPGHPDQPLVVDRNEDAMNALRALLGGDDAGGLGGLGALGDGGSGGTIGGILGGMGSTGLGGLGFGGLGTIGHDGGDQPGAPTTTVRAGDAEVRGSLSREVIQRVIRRHINEVRFCYEQGLVAHPHLAGRVVVNFIIGSSGAVQGASIQSSDLANPPIEQCIVAATRRWMFPSPEGGGIVVVTYPFSLTDSPPPPSGRPAMHDGYGS